MGCLDGRNGKEVEAWRWRVVIVNKTVFEPACQASQARARRSLSDLGLSRFIKQTIEAL